MDLRYTDAEEAFRRELRAWLESHGYADLDVVRTAEKTIEDPTQLRVRDFAP